MKILMLAMMLASAICVTLPQAEASEDPYTIFKTKGAFEDVAQDLEDAIVDKGLVIQQKGMLGEMLDRTSKAVGEESIYKNARYLTFCSAKLSHAATRADPNNITICPYSVFVYERQGTQDEIVVGFRKAVGGKSPESLKALEAINVLLEEIARDALQ